MKKKNSLDQLDQWFSSKGSSASNYFYIGLFLAGLVAYFVLSGYANPYLSESESNLNSATDKLIAAQEEYTNKFNGDPEGFVKTKRNALNAEKTRRDNIIAERTYLDKKLEEISKLTYNEKNWATFIDSLSTIAENNNVKIYAIHSDKRMPSVEQKFVPEALLDISVQFEGAFANVLKYINLIEQSEMIVDVNKMDINATKNGKIGGKIGISIWGVNYK